MSIWTKEIKFKSNYILRIYIPFTYFFIMVLSYLKKPEVVSGNLGFFENLALTMALVVLIPTFVSLPSVVKSKDFKTFEEFFKNRYSKFIIFMTFVFIPPVFVFGASSFPLLLMTAHLLKASEVVKMKVVYRLLYFLVTSAFIYFNFYYPDISEGLRYFYYLLLILLGSLFN